MIIPGDKPDNSAIRSFRRVGRLASRSLRVNSPIRRRVSCPRGGPRGHGDFYFDKSPSSRYHLSKISAISKRRS